MNFHSVCGKCGNICRFHIIEVGARVRVDAVECAQCGNWLNALTR